MFSSAVLQLEGSELLENQSERFSGKFRLVNKAFECSPAHLRFLKLTQMFFHQRL